LVLNAVTVKYLGAEKIIIMAPEDVKNTQKADIGSDSKDCPYAVLRALYDTSPDMILIYGPKGKLLDANPSALAYFQYSKPDFQRAKSTQYLWKSNSHQNANKSARAAGKNRQLHQTEWTARRKDGTEFPVEVQTQTLPNGLDIKGVPAQTVTIVRDISNRKAYESKILQMAHFDPVTGLINRALIEDRARQAIRRSKRHHNKLAFLFMDLDFFKKINDQYGHRTGDLLLKAVGARVQGILRDNDTFGRLGGDEFLLLAEEINYTDDAMFIADKIIKTLGEPFGINGHVISMGTSIGISLFPDHGTHLTQLMQNADKAMYRAKELGRNKLAVYNPNLYRDLDD
jgi:diguanylate cyclase (GGDEF)-like protein/PAS domain S-box-containing protein